MINISKKIFSKITPFSWVTSPLCFGWEMWLQLYRNLQNLSNKNLSQFSENFVFQISENAKVKKKLTFFPCFAKTVDYFQRKGFFKKIRQTFVSISLLYRFMQKLLKIQLWRTCCSRNRDWYRIFGPFFLHFVNMSKEYNIYFLLETQGLLIA